LDHDRDPAETREWLDALDSVEAFEGIGRVDELLNGIVQAARRKGAKPPFAANTAYVNTIAPHDEPAHPGDRAIEHRIRSLIRWNAAAIVLRANKTSSELGGHIASFQSAATLYDTGFMHFWRAPTDTHGGDLVYYQGHCSPGINARAFLEGRQGRQLKQSLLSR
jgi:pyruvate dehydrogenase E1 component